MNPMDDEQTEDPRDDEPMTDTMDNEPVTDSSHKPGKLRTTWKIPDLCQTCVHTKQQQHVTRTKASRT